jgi:hypothetical protein
MYVKSVNQFPAGVLIYQKILPEFLPHAESPAVKKGVETLG